MTQALRLVLLRHGQSEWNADGIFTGWENASLTATGEEGAAGVRRTPVHRLAPVL
jgi:2,3-bisphosphoglycerate-dependent phosphoglycerate mutase